MVKRFSLIMGAAMVLAASVALGAEKEAAGAVVSYPPWLTALALASGFGIALAAFGGAMAQGRAASTALEGVARNPGAGGRIQTLLILGLALIESLVIYALVIAFMLQGKLPSVEVIMQMMGLE